MDYRKYILELGTGVDLHGEDETKAAQRAVKDAISHSSMVGLGQLFKIGSFKEMSPRQTPRRSMATRCLASCPRVTGV